MKIFTFLILLEEMEELQRQIFQLGSVIDEQLFLQYVLEALPDAYNHLKQNILTASAKKGNADYCSYQQAKNILLAAIQQDKSLPGASPPGIHTSKPNPTAVVHNTQKTTAPADLREECRKNQEGRCTNGTNCKYSHTVSSTINPRGQTCFICKSQYHLARYCPQKSNSNSRGGRGFGRSRNARHGQNKARVNYTQQDDLVNERFDIPAAYVTQTAPVKWLCYNSIMQTKDQELAWIIDTGANTAVVSSLPMIARAVNITQSKPSEVIVGGRDQNYQ